MTTLKFHTSNKLFPAFTPRYPNKESAIKGRDGHLDTLSPLRINKRTDSRNIVLRARFNNGENYRSVVQVVTNCIGIVSAYGCTGKEGPGLAADR